jgi:Flp pilus assembly pilin Flp
MLQKLLAALRDERGISAVEVLIIMGLLAAIAVGAYTVLKPKVEGAAGGLGTKLENTVIKDW